MVNKTQHPILTRFKKANNCHYNDLNCISALFYLLGYDSVEEPHEISDIKRIPLERMLNKEKADVLIMDNPLHYMILDPSNKEYIIHRNGYGSLMTRQTLISLIWLDIACSPISTFDMKKDLKYFKVQERLATTVSAICQ